MEWLPACERNVADLLSRHQRFAFFYSGGLESSLLLHLAEPWRDKVTVYTLRTGAEFPHMISFIDRKIANWDHVVIKRDLGASFAEIGLPSSVVPIEHMAGSSETLLSPERSPRIVHWPACCGRNRSLGVADINDDRISAVLSGVRAGDYGVPLDMPTGAQMEVSLPLWEMSRADVCKAVSDLEIELPDHYPVYPNSLDCSICPAALSSQRQAWMAGRYPERLAVAKRLHAEISQAVIASLDADNTRLGRRPV